MDWFQSIDTSLFRFINQKMSNPVFDRLMPFLSGNSVFYPLLLGLAVWMIWRFRQRGILCALFLLITISIGDPIICNSLKDLFGRPRPFVDITDTVLRVGRGGSFSFPSSHAANWFASAAVAMLFFRRSWRWMFPLAAAVAFSRVYNGVHYPSDVVGGGILGMAYGFGIVKGSDFLWRRVFASWFPFWFRRMPSLLPDGRVVPEERVVAWREEEKANPAEMDRHWLRLGYCLIVLMLFARLLYLASGKIELSEDETYQWAWSKNPALSYYSKPPFIAYAQYIGTHIWGDTEFGVRFLSPVMAAALSLLLLRFLAREVNARVGLCLIMILSASPLPGVGSILMTIDPLSVLFWTAAMLAGWKAVNGDSTRLWAWTGFWIGMGFLSKYTALFQLMCFAVFFVLWKPARRHLSRPGPWVALGVLALCTLPVLIWNSQHGWITVTHLKERGGLEQAWKFKPNFLIDFTLQEFALLNPIIIVGSIWAAITFWRRERHNPFLVFLFSMGTPLFLFYWLYTIRARVQPNWIAPALVPMFCLGVVYWYQRWLAGNRAVLRWFWGVLALGLPIVVLLHDTNLVTKITGISLRYGKDPLSRVRGWTETSAVINAERLRVEKETGKPVFIVCAHYGWTSQLAFYIPESRTSIPDNRFVYFLTSEIPHNQYYFWDGYKGRVGQDALLVIEVDPGDKPPKPPAIIESEFESVTDLGEFAGQYRGRKLHVARLYHCKNLRPPAAR